MEWAAFECEVFFCGKENILEFAKDGCYTTLLIY